ncbi:MAG: PilW family protein [Burkholderiales bacterium]|jgi:type IV pilus assembly protein PilW|nr:PilW family protein [Burkholderiales bacterium]
MKTHAFHRKPKGFTIVEILVGLLIGLLLIYAVYTVYEQHNRVRRVTTSVNEAQVSSLYSMFLLEQTVSNAGAAMMYDPPSGSSPFRQLLRCQDAALPTSSPANWDGILRLPSSTNGSLSLYPFPIVIDSATVGGNRHDELYLFSGASSRYIMAITNGVPATLNVGNGNTFALPINFANGDTLVAVNATTNTCAPFLVTTSVLTPPNNLQVTLQGVGAFTPTAIVNVGMVVRYHFFVNPQNALQMDEYQVTNTGVWTLASSTSIVSDVRVFAAQYGIDADGNNVVDRWVNATNDADGTTGSFTWDPVNLMRTEGNTALLGDEGNIIKRIKAIRVGIVVRMEEPEKQAPSPMTTQTLTLFGDCTPQGATCPPPIIFTHSTGDGPAGTTFRYRKYETTIPLKNVIWNPTNALT